MPRQTLTPEPKPAARFAGWLTLFVLFVILVVLVALVRTKGIQVKEARTAQRKTGPPPVNVVTLTLSPVTISDKINLPAEILAFKTLDLPVEVSATLLEKSVSEGQFVQEGMVVARLDPDRYAARLNAARSSLAQAKATQKRLKNLHRTKLATDADVENAITGFDQARSALISAQIDLDRCTLKAPFDGFLDRYTLEEGTFATPGTPICRILDISKVKVRVGIPESDVMEAKKPEAIRVYVQALGDTPLEGGSILRLSRNARNMAKLYDLDLLFDNRNHTLLPDMFARVELVKKRHEKALVVPLYAVITRKEEKRVFVMVNGKAEMRRVSTGIQEEWLVEITQGLQAGEKVIVTGQRAVSEGRAVHVVKEIFRAEELGF